MTRPLVDAVPPFVPDWRQLAALASTSETLLVTTGGPTAAITVVATTAPLALSVTVMLSPLGMALGATAVIT
jgi:hypothetical protein